ncbi:MAG: hypothetical protein JJV95_07330 [Sulfurospirillum sp.]|nr:hypothetical protein [Sulfurospirillum sp.]MBL0703772.1 hypothetical protein [Sulfurospirillum sp.]
MLENVLHDRDFGVAMERHVEDVLEILLKKNICFSILANMTDINFEPALPKKIRSTFRSITVFFLAGYTFESCIIDKNIISFEAGFGQENYSSLVSISLSSILQIIVDETPILINLSVASKNEYKNKKKGIKRSMEVLLSNPENEKLLK